MKKYLLVQRNYEYNDEIFSETEGSNPILIFANKTIAEQEALKRNKKWFKENDLDDYCYSIKDILPYRKEAEATKALNEVGIYLNQNQPNKGVPTDLSDNQIEVLIKYIGFLPAYYVEEVDYVE